MNSIINRRIIYMAILFAVATTTAQASVPSRTPPNGSMALKSDHYRLFHVKIKILTPVRKTAKKNALFAGSTASCSGG